MKVNEHLAIQTIKKILAFSKGLYYNDGTENKDVLWNTGMVSQQSARAMVFQRASFLYARKFRRNHLV